MASINRLRRVVDVSFFANSFPDRGRWNTIEEAMFPELEMNFEDFSPGGSPVGIEVETHINKLVGGIKLKGTDADMEGLFGKRDRFTFYGAVVDVRTAAEIRRTYTMDAIMGKAAPEAFQKAGLQGYEYALNSILSYTVKEGDKVVMDWDFDDPSRLTIGGQSLRQGRAAVLNLA